MLMTILKIEILNFENDPFINKKSCMPKELISADADFMSKMNIKNN